MNRRDRSRSPFASFFRSGGSRYTRMQPAFWILAGFLLLVFATGGSSRADVPLLFVLRPVAILAGAYGLATLRRDHVIAYRYLFALAAAILVLTVIHLVPLPPVIWERLPGHDLVRAIDAAAGMSGQWRPLSLVPSKTVNALYALSVPVATLILAAQLTIEERIRILYVLLTLSSVSAIVGLLQAAGIPFSLYHSVSAPQTIEAAGLFANQNHQAALLATTIPMLAVMARIGGHRERSTRLLKPLAGAGIAAIIVLLIVTGSRAGLALGAVALAFTLFYGLLQVDRLDRMAPRTAMGIRLAVGLGLAAVAVLVTMLTSRGLALNRLETLGTDLRPKLWSSIVPILPDFQPWGSGIGSYVEVYRWYEPMNLLRETYSNHAHNEYLEVALTAGVPGLLLLGFASVLLVAVLWRNRRGSEPVTILARLGAVIIVVYACASATDYPLRTPLLSAVAVLAATWCTGARAIRRSRNAGTGSEAEAAAA